MYLGTTNKTSFKHLIILDWAFDSDRNISYLHNQNELKFPNWLQIT